MKHDKHLFPFHGHAFVKLDTQKPSALHALRQLIDTDPELKDESIAPLTRAGIFLLIAAYEFFGLGQYKDASEKFKLIDEDIFDLHRESDLCVFYHGLQVHLLFCAGKFTEIDSATKTLMTCVEKQYEKENDLNTVLPIFCKFWKARANMELDFPHDDVKRELEKLQLLHTEICRHLSDKYGTLLQFYQYEIQLELIHNDVIDGQYYRAYTKIRQIDEAYLLNTQQPYARYLLARCYLMMRRYTDAYALLSPMYGQLSITSRDRTPFYMGYFDCIWGCVLVG